ncbi:MAG: RluA family pseudouridine synthase [Myxococcota bacterium]
MVDAAQGGARLDKVLAALASVGSREKARQVLRSGKVSVDGADVGFDHAGQPVAAGARIAIAWTRPGTGAKRVAAREALSRAQVTLLFEDDAIVVADKPAGLLTDAADTEQARNEDTLRKRVKAWLGGRPVFPAHRIDRDTTGVVVFAKTPAAREALKAQWITRSPRRVYLVVVEGRFGKQSGRFGDWMAWDGATRVQRPCEPDHPGAWFAEADFEVTRRFGDRATQLEVRLISGRRNQIRLHAMLAGHPLVGEPLYRRREAVIPFGRQALHAYKLGLLHPTTREPVTFEAPIPADLAGLIASLG